MKIRVVSLLVPLLAVASACAVPIERSEPPAPASETAESSVEPSATPSPSAEPTTPTTESAVPSPSATPSSDPGVVTCAYEPFGEPAVAVDPPDAEDVAATGTVNITIAMNEGDVQITMDRAQTPCTINSFLALASQGYFDDTRCHRLVDSGLFLLQCGDPSGTGAGSPGYRFADELTGDETYPAGTVAMANAGPDTNGSQFFLVYADTQLPPNYTVFGQMSEAGLGVVGRIADMGHDSSNPAGGGKPFNQATIESVTVG